MAYVEALILVFSLLNMRDLASCMQVCKQWREIAGDDYFWKSLCAKLCPSISKRSFPPPISSSQLFQMFSKCCTRLSFDDLEFYIDIWAEVDGSKRKRERSGLCAEERLIFSEVIPGSVVTSKQLLLDIQPKLCSCHPCKLTIPLKPSFSNIYHKLSVSVVVGRRDINKVACIVKKTVMDYQYGDASHYLDFSSRFCPFKSLIRPQVYLLYIESPDDWDIDDVYGIELLFDDTDGDDDDDDDDDDKGDDHWYQCEEKFLWLLGMLNWY